MTELQTEIVEAAQKAVQTDQDLRERVRTLTLNALRQRRLDREEIASVSRSVLQGIQLGMGERTQDAGQALKEAVSGLDEALSKTAHALGLAVQQAVGEGKGYVSQDLATQWQNLKSLEGDFMRALADTAAAAKGQVKGQVKDVFEHLSRTSTDTSSQVRDILERLGGKVEAILRDGKTVASDGAREAASRIAMAASGLLAGLADALQQKADSEK
jgi:Family of unknown function (DUF6781)